MRILNNNPLLSFWDNYLKKGRIPFNLSYLWNFGLLLAFCLVIQIVTGVTLTMYYNPSVAEAFNSVEHIMRDVNNGWLKPYLHCTASAFFFLVYLHVGRALYYRLYKAPRTLLWIIGTIILVLMIATAFLGYVSPNGQMSLWGGFSVNNATLNRFFVLHFFLPFILAALALIHLIALHNSAGKPLFFSGNYDRLPMTPYFFYKELILLAIKIIVILAVFILLIYLLIKLFSIFLPICYCMDEATELRLDLQSKIAKVQLSFNYWNDQCKAWNTLYQQSLISGNIEDQKFNLIAKKESEANLNTDSHLLRRLKDKLSSGDYSFNSSVTTGKRKFTD